MVGVARRHGQPSHPAINTVGPFLFRESVYWSAGECWWSMNSHMNMNEEVQSPLLDSMDSVYITLKLSYQLTREPNWSVILCYMLSLRPLCSHLAYCLTKKKCLVQRDTADELVSHCSWWRRTWRQFCTTIVTGWCVCLGTRLCCVE